MKLVASTAGKRFAAEETNPRRPMRAAGLALGSRRRTRLSVAVSAAVLGVPVGAGAVAEHSHERLLETVVVTATKREASAQDVPVAMNALRGETLRDLGIETFDEYVEYLPNVVSAGNGPGQKEIYVRGSATEQTSITVSTAQGLSPGVALYLDEQPVSFGGRNLDVYGADLERIEVLFGPQGTLFGASSQSGILRLITRQPNPARFEAGVNARYGVTRGGADSTEVDAFANIPLTRSLAARAVVYSVGHGGWIDNIPATFTPSGEVVDRNNVGGYGPPLTGADFIESARNDAIVQDDSNDVSYRGGRLGLLYDSGESWEALLQHSAQTLATEGSFLVDPGVGEEHAAARFSPESSRDDFGLTTWTVQGRLRNLDVIYTGGHLTRDVDATIDFTHYNNGGGYITYYLCSGNIFDPADANNCYDPTKQYAEDTQAKRTTHEFRIATEQSQRVRLLGGVYANEAEHRHLGDFQYASANDAFAEHISNYRNDDSGAGFLLGNETLPTAGANSVGPRPPATVFFNDFTRTVEELAAFGEIAVDVGQRWSVALSARRYDITSRLQGAANLSFGCRYGIGPNARRTDDGRCNGTDFSNDVSVRLRTLGLYNASGDDGVILNARSPNGEDGTPRDLFRGGGSNQATLNAIKNGSLDLSRLRRDGAVQEVDTIMKATLNWQPNDETRLFVTYAEGYRPATLNRNAGQLANNQTGVFEGYAVPAVAVTDHLRSWELGLKGNFPARHLRLNATAYATRIENLQVSRYDPSNVAFLIFVENAGDAAATGVDADFEWAASRRLTLTGAFSWLHTELVRVNPQLDGIVVPVGSELPLAPRFAGNLRARYAFAVDAFGADAYVQAVVNHRGRSVSGMVGSAEFMEDTLYRQAGRHSGLKWRHEGGTFGTVPIRAGATMASRLPANSRFVNPAATTFNLSFGVAKDGWTAEVFVDNASGETAEVVQVTGHYVPVVTVQRPRTIGLRLAFRADG